MKIVFDMAQFNVLPYNGTEKSYCTFAEGKDEAYSDKFEQLGIQSHNFILNADSCMQVYLLYFSVLAFREYILLPILRALERNNCLNKFQSILSWSLGNYSWQQKLNGLFILTKQFYQTLTISCILHFHRFWISNLAGEVLASFYAIIFAAVIILLPLIFTLLWFFKHPLFHNISNRMWCQHLFENLMIDKKGGHRQLPLLWEILKLWRIIINACCIIFFKGHCILQLIALQMTSLAAIAFMLTVKPFKQGGWIEATNEIAQFLYCQLMFMQTNVAVYKSDIERTRYEREIVGQWQLGLIIFIGVLGLVPLILTKLQSLYTWVKSHFEVKPAKPLYRKYAQPVTDFTLPDAVASFTKIIAPFRPEPIPQHWRLRPIEYGPNTFTLAGIVDAEHSLWDDDKEERDISMEGREPEVDPAVFARNTVKQSVLKLNVQRESLKFVDSFQIQKFAKAQQDQQVLTLLRPDHNLSQYSATVYRDDQSSHLRYGPQAAGSRLQLQMLGPEVIRVNRWLQRDNQLGTALNSTIDIHDINADLRTSSGFSRRIDSGFNMHRQSFDLQHPRVQSSTSNPTPIHSNNIRMFRRSVQIEGGGLNMINGEWTRKRPSQQQIALIRESIQEQKGTPQLEETKELHVQNVPASEESAKLIKKNKKRKQKVIIFKGNFKLEMRTKNETMTIYNQK
ncbi:hypothetical protein FGO68_gene14672 [Halteria grandinella]|uniref:Uncharacterized protein n=1 Tax=Halteria grandinella TaxID=5974 RepID=A0A8J8NFW6_HALGN|nr:hypothetical protein FGO68_gene14672 [Halteria grandinella]